MTEPPLATQPSLGHTFRGTSAELRFVGRTRQRAQLVSALPPSSEPLRIVSGEAGIGKSRLVAEVVAEAAKRGTTSVWGLCRDPGDATPPFWPWVQVVRTLLRAPHGADLGELLLQNPRANRPDLFHAVADLLDEKQEATPLVIALEDLHEADLSSLALLRFLVQERQIPNTLILGTFRSGEARDPAVAKELELLSPPRVRVDLGGLSLSELRSLVPADGPDVRELYDITGGNPLFAEQVLRLWVARGDLRARDGFIGVAAASSLRAVTRSRLQRLSNSTRTTLAALAVYGRPATLAELSSVLEEPAAQVTECLASALAAGVIVASPPVSPREFRFTHALLAKAAVALATPAYVLELHLRCAESLAGQVGAAAERAHHLLQAGVDHADEALEACEAAGAEASAALAFEDAVVHYRAALRLIDLYGAGDSTRRLRASKSLGAAHATAQPPEAELDTPESRPTVWGGADSENGRLGPAIVVMGRFEVTATDGSLPRWTSRKARALLQLLVAARGAPVSRERLMDILWPGEDPAVLGNRMSVAISTIRRALDPGRVYSARHFLHAERNILRLNRDCLTIDVEEFLRSASDAMGGPGAPDDDALTRAFDLYTGDVFADEPYEDWAQQLRYEAQAIYTALCRMRVGTDAAKADPLLAAELHRRVLDVDPYDEVAHRGLIDALTSLGVLDQLRLAKKNYQTMMAELAS